MIPAPGFNSHTALEDYVTNHALPMVLVGQGGCILYCNLTMSRLIGKSLQEIRCKIPRNIFYENPEDFDRIFQVIKNEGCIMGEEMLLKTTNGAKKYKLYSNLHKDENGTLINTRCIFIPVD